MAKEKVKKKKDDGLVEVTLTQRQFIGLDEHQKGDTFKVSKDTAARMKKRDLIN